MEYGLQILEIFTIFRNMLNKKNILKAQSTDVDGMSGATVSSNAVKEAVNEALEKAK